MLNFLPWCLFIVCCLSPLCYADITADTRSAAACELPQINSEPIWWKESVAYQVYLKSFKDANGDGIGDIRGLIQKLDYLKGLGVDIIWITPHYDSPNKDNGYDINDYRKVLKEYGTMQDFEELAAGIKKRGMHLMVDVVTNHTSSEHKWFVESRKSKNNPYRDYYIWRDGKNGGPPNNDLSYFGGSAWEKDDATGQYYLHYYSQNQPDLNWDNPKVREEIKAMLQFWIDRGVTGLRMDSISTISKNAMFTDLTPQQIAHFPEVYAAGPHIHDYLKALRNSLSQYNDLVIIGELPGVNLNKVLLFVDSRAKQLDMPILFNIIYLGRDTVTRWKQTFPVTLSGLRKEICRSNTALGNHGWNSFFIGNHDNPRALSQFGSDDPKWRVSSAKALATLLLTQRGTPFIYQGDEIGMTNFPYARISDFSDIEIKGFWKQYVESGQVSPEEFLKNIKITARENSRTPYQWDSSKQAGFTSGTPWINVNPNYKEINLKKELSNGTSVYAYYKKMIAVRHRIPALTYGSYQDIDLANNAVYAYTRTLGNERYLIVINFTSQTADYTLPEGLTLKATVIESDGTIKIAPKRNALTLRPWQSGIYALRQS